MTDEELDIKEWTDKIVAVERNKKIIHDDVNYDRVDNDYMYEFVTKYSDIFEIDYSEGATSPYETVLDYIVIKFAGDIVYEAKSPNRTQYDYRLRKSDLENFLKEKDYRTLSKIFLF